MDVATQTHLHMLRDALVYRLGTLQADVHAAQLADEQRPDAQDELTATTAALARLDSATYGDCSDCQEPIGLSRLQLMPAAPRCAACQRRHDEDSQRAT